MTDIIATVINAEKKAIRALDKAQGGIMDNLRKLVEHEAFSAAMVGSYLTNFEEAMLSIGYDKNNSTYKVMKSQRKKVLSFCAGALDQQGEWTDTQVDIEAERIMQEPSLQKAYAAVSESLKDAKAEPEGEGDSEGEGEETTEDAVPTHDEMLNGIFKLVQGYVDRGARPCDARVALIDAYDILYKAATAEEETEA
jgi:hypothetical protein